MLKQRVITALILAPLGIAAVLLLPPERFWWLLAALFGVAAWEWSQFIGISGPAPRSLLALAFGAAVLLAGINSHLLPDSILVGGAGAGLWVLLAGWLGRRKLGADTSTRSRLLKLMTAVLIFSASALSLGMLFSFELGRYWLLTLLFIIWGADVGAYFTGKAMGRHKLAPNISPGKTWEGVWGGAVLVVIVCIVASQLFELSRPASVGLVLTGLVTASISIVGDLFVSLMKRQSGLKDAGSIFPGHGGVLDRFDSLIAAAPVFLLGHSLLH